MYASNTVSLVEKVFIVYTCSLRALIESLYMHSAYSLLHLKG